MGGCDRPLDSVIPCNKNSFLMTTTHFPATKTHFSRQQLISLQQKLISHDRRFLSIRLVFKLSLVSMRIIVLQACFSEIYQLLNSIISEWFCTLILERIFKTILCCAPFHGSVSWLRVVFIKRNSKTMYC